MTRARQIRTTTASRRLVATVGLTVVIALAAGCSSDGAAPTTSPPSTSSGPDGTGVSTGAPTTALATTSTLPSVPVPRYVDEHGFDDHTVPAVTTVSELLALGRSGVGGQSAIKFAIPDFHRSAGEPGVARAHLFDGAFYDLHDEWWYFRLLNGQPVPGAEVQPVGDLRFATVDEIYTWARAHPAGAPLPLDLRWEGERLYSAAFYQAALHGEPRRLGAGSIVRFPDPDPAQPDHWLIELEYSDAVTPQHVAQFFARLAPILPAEVGPRLEWVVRSPQHEQVAQQMVAAALPYHDRIVRYRDLVPAGTVGVYNEGITAGRLLYVGEGGAELGDAKVGDIVVTEHVPDWLPQASALITSDPQTPLAHVNLLARNRRMPNASRAGIHDDAGLRQAARVRAHAVVVAEGSSLQVALISRAQHDAWIAAGAATPVQVPAVDLAGVPLVVDLDQLVAQLGPEGPTEADLATWTPIIGGKSAGFLTLLSTPGLTPPPDPLAITVRPYLEHLAPLRDGIAAAISDPAVAGSAQARWLILEGPDGYAELFPSDEDARTAESFTASHPVGTPVGDVLAAGGVRRLVGSTPIDPATLDEIVGRLRETYGHYDVETGLRFRSSSSVEDIEGFNGAGLHTSYTGFLHPDELADEDDRDNTVERAILRAWASYWSFEAFEERRQAQIDHLSGAMGVTVHARFDDDLEVNNGVATFTFLPDGAGDDAVLEINVQAGAVEVTNPDPDDVQLPEVIRVTRRGGVLTMERVSASTLVEDGGPVLDDGAVAELFEQTSAVAERWRRRVNRPLPPSQQVRTVVLDYEFKTVAPGWPELDDAAGAPFPGRLVLRQVRSLDPGLRPFTADVRALPIPRDVLMRASLVERISCSEPHASPDAPEVVRVEVLTDPLLAPDMGYAERPFVAGPSGSPQAACTRTTEFASPGRALVELVERGDAFVIIG